MVEWRKGRRGGSKNHTMVRGEAQPVCVEQDGKGCVPTGEGVNGDVCKMRKGVNSEKSCAGTVGEDGRLPSRKGRPLRRMKKIKHGSPKRKES